MARPKKQPISPDEYHKILSGLEIVRIDVDEFSGKVIDRTAIGARENKRPVSLAEKARFTVGDNGDFIVWHTYNIAVSETEEETAAKLLTLSVDFRVAYASRETVTEEFFQQFRKVSLQIQTAPFARAWIHDHCLRMGVPALIMPLVVTPRAAPRRSATVTASPGQPTP